MTIRALAIPESVTHGSTATSQARFAMTPRALDFGVNAFEWIVRQLLVVETLDVEGVSQVTGVTLALRRGETELPRVNVAVAAPALTWRTAVRGASSTQPVLLRRGVATVTGRFRVSACQRPDTVIDPR